MSKIWAAEASHDVSSVPMIGVGQVASNGFRSLYAALPGDVVAAPARAPIHAEPETDPIDEAHMAGFSQGFEEGYRAAGEDQANEIEARNRLTAALEMLAPAPSGSLSTMLSATVVRLVEQIVGEVQIDLDRLTQRCEAVAAFIDDSSDKSALHLHPDDVALLEGEQIGVSLVSDKSMQRGCVRLETADGWVEDGPDVRLARLRALMDDMEGKA
ncbi:FliH/SctL family protein [Sphingobium yanoikuyae]|uniref:FliH/SctL family protein n=1 Tax=Sphingobium yanoikuyae TaxID=13690 RepID=UPI002420377B|nr:FliH/SctL family protein [Sphingobium yanoikuyae]